MTWDDLDGITWYYGLRVFEMMMMMMTTMMMTTMTMIMIIHDDDREYDDDDDDHDDDADCYQCSAPCGQQQHPVEE